MALLTQLFRSMYLTTRLLASLFWALLTLPWHRLQAERAFRRALERKGLSRREVEELTRLYRKNSLQLRPALKLLKGALERGERPE